MHRIASPSHPSHRLFPALMTLLTVLLLAQACGDTTGEDPVDDQNPADQAGDVLKSELERDTAPDISAEQLDTLSQGNTAFALDLYQQLRSEDGNIFYSPYSISAALAMTYGGARGNTAAEIEQVMHYNLGQDDTHTGFNALDLALASRGQDLPSDDQGGDPFQLNIVNDIWGQTDYDFSPEYLDLLALNYGAGLRALDFFNDPEASRETINLWIEEQTRERIKDLLPEGSINAGTRMVLTNAIYFKASWENPFEEASTRPADFTNLNGEVTQVDTMFQGETMGYASGEGYQAVELPYKGREMSMVIIAPEAGTFSDFEAELDADSLRAITDAISPNSVFLAMPKFEYDDPTPLTNVLQDMGMLDAFSDRADLSGIDGTGGLQITDVIHKAFVGVDEAGTEAAAATAVIVGETSAPQFEEVNLDRPFIFLIRDIDTETILFMGRVTEL